MPNPTPPTLTSRSFSAERQLKGQQYRSGTLGRADQDMRNDIDDAFNVIEGNVGLLTRTGVYPTPAAGAELTAGAQDLTAAGILTGIVVQTSTGANQHLTLPTGALLLAAMPGTPAVGDSFTFSVVSGKTSSHPFNVAQAASGCTQTGGITVVAQTSATWLVRFTDVTTGAYTAHRIAG